MTLVDQQPSNATSRSDQQFEVLALGAPAKRLTDGWCEVKSQIFAGQRGSERSGVLAPLQLARAAIEAKLMESGALLFRGLGSSGDRFLCRFIESVSTGPIEYEERSSPRSEVGERIYTSTTHPADQEIFLHNEHSYAHRYPSKIFFHCVRPSREGGQTPLADCRAVLERLSSQIRSKFERLGWMCVRNFGGGLGLDWTEAFRTRERNEVERYCQQNDIEFEWRGDRLRTRQVRPAIALHPTTKEEVWFNHVAFFHVSTLPQDLRDGLLVSFAEEDLPNNTYYGDGSRIDEPTLEQIRAAYLAERRTFDWREGDVLMVDNLLVAHGRMPFLGDRLVLVGMSEPHTRESFRS